MTTRILENWKCFMEEGKRSERAMPSILLPNAKIFEVVGGKVVRSGESRFEGGMRTSITRSRTTDPAS